MIRRHCMVLLLPLLLHIQGDEANVALVEPRTRIAILEGPVTVLTDEVYTMRKRGTIADLMHAQVL
jgi:hypothetical protein